MVETQACPMCAEEIQADARVCEFCGTMFEVTRTGYCSNCHRVVRAGTKRSRVADEFGVPRSFVRRAGIEDRQ